MAYDGEHGWVIDRRTERECYSRHAEKIPCANCGEMHYEDELFDYYDGTIDDKGKYTVKHLSLCEGCNEALTQDKRERG